MAQNLQGLSYEVCLTDIATVLHTQIVYPSFWDMYHYTPAACCYVMRIHEIRLKLKLFPFWETPYRFVTFQVISGLGNPCKLCQLL